MSRTVHLTVVAALALVAACDRQAQSAADSAALAADLALVAQSQPVYPQFQDTALNTRTETKAPAKPTRGNPEGLRPRNPPPRPRPAAVPATADPANAPAPAPWAAPGC